ncbi:MAG: Gfo/Idh/MocA family oxidoreductase [Pontiellaceae bacterium]|nr:Gfo/Idh/MocA family oxidoreductase [Pontiellaceae bacterium]MBN2786073.1 Gfo/Idh/MocA family oxidoreductase [Pontiellaceae bacterium]
MLDIRWGIIGCGGIARTFAISLRALGYGELLAGASRTPGRAQAFCTEHNIPRYYTGYEQLVSDPDIDAVYVATTHNFHYGHVRLALEHGKHVLCEKPFTVNAAQAAELIELARSRKRFLMEAVWTRFLPSIQTAQKLIAEGTIGDVQTVYANFCLGKSVPPDHRLRNINLAGGALLDLGIYPISMADLVFGQKPERIVSSAVMDPETGVDEHSYYLFEYTDGRKAVLSASYSQRAPVEAVISGTGGFIRLPHFLGAQEVHLHRNGEPPETFEFPYGELENFKYEIAHAMECIAAGQTESSILPPAKTLETMQTMDALRQQWNLVYPGEAN